MKFETTCLERNPDLAVVAFPNTLSSTVIISTFKFAAVAYEALDSIQVFGPAGRSKTQVPAALRLLGAQNGRSSLLGVAGTLEMAARAPRNRMAARARN